MDESTRRSSVDSTGANSNNSFNKDSESAFSVAPLITESNASKGEDSPQKTNPTFIQNQISIQRSESAAKEHATLLSRQLSNRSSASGKMTSSRINKLMETPVKESVPPGHEDRGRGRSDSNSSANDIPDHMLSKTSSGRSSKSVKSVRELNAVGTYAYGTLRVHSPSPTRTPKVYFFHLADLR